VLLDNVDIVDIVDIVDTVDTVDIVLALVLVELSVVVVVLDAVAVDVEVWISLVFSSPSFGPLLSLALVLWVLACGASCSVSCGSLETLSVRLLRVVCLLLWCTPLGVFGKLA